MLKFGRQKNIKILQLLAIKLNYSKCPETKIVKLPVGNVKGRLRPDYWGNEFYSFEGIPYGKPPIGEFRFQPSQPAEPWKELDCQKERDPPVQFDRDTDSLIGKEDCLYLNVYTKHFNASHLMPVIVYFHGGAFQTGGAIRRKYGPEYIMREDIVFVIFSYRLCALGFLSLSNPESGLLGNAGLHDQLLALHWVNKNISYFNGDPKNITIMGTSAGSASVHFMMCLPQASGLFHRAIMMSGSMLSPWVQVPNTETFAYRLAKYKGYKGNDSDSEVLQFLRTLAAEELVQHHLFIAKELCFGHLYPFVPTLESKSSKGLLQRPFLQMMKQAWSGQIPLLIGGTSFEGLMMYPHCKANSGQMMDLLEQQPARILPYDLFECLSKDERDERSAQLIRYHYGPRSITKSSVMQTLDHFSYKLFWHAIHRVVISRLTFAQAPTYVYRFDFDSPTSNLMRRNLCGDDIKVGVCHADELGYIFPRDQIQLNSAGKCTVHRMVGILTAFARTGNPNCAETGIEQWPSVDRKEPFKVMNIGYKLEAQSQPEKEGIKIWNQIYNDDACLLYGG